ncbi:MAG: BON domain-containing protein [Desulfomonilia bacterium]
MSTRTHRGIEMVRQIMGKCSWPHVTGLLVVGLLMLGAPGAGDAREITDFDITIAVQREFVNDPGVMSHQIDVKTEDGVAVLSGIVDNIRAKDRATLVAESIRGVRSVVNRITVSPPEKVKDSEIQENVKRILLYDPATDSYDIKVKVDDGVVTLTGNVDSWQERKLAGTVAKGVSGVVGLNSDILVTYETDRLDEDIENEIEARLDWDVLVDARFIKVDVDDGKVMLKGRVGSAREKTHAMTLSWVADVSSVNTDAVDIDWAMRDEMKRDTAVIKTDEEIRTAILDAFRYDPRVYSFNPDVKVSGGIVTLTGTVSNLMAKNAAEQDAENTAGVWRVKNYLRVRPTLSWMDNDDEQIQRTIRNRFVFDPVVDSNEIGVKVLNGKAYLTGMVDTTFEKMEAEDIASSVKGVIVVQNNIDVRPYAVNEKSDWEIRQDINDELWWSPFVDANEVTVTVNDGVVTLTGTVDSWSEYRAAVKNAYDGGAESVINELKVENAPEQISAR